MLKELSDILIEKIMEELKEKNLNPSSGVKNRKFIMSKVNFPPTLTSVKLIERQAAFSASEFLDIFTLFEKCICDSLQE